MFFVPVKVSSAGWKSAGRHPASIAGKSEGPYKRTSPPLCVSVDCKRLKEEKHRAEI